MRKVLFLSAFALVSLLFYPTASGAVVMTINGSSAMNQFLATTTGTTTMHMRVVETGAGNNTHQFMWDSTPWRVDQGGTGAASFTSGSILFISDGVFSENNFALYWDQLTNTLSVGGTSTPPAKLSVRGATGMALLNLVSSLGSSLFYVSELGALGIGNANPQHMLDVAGAFYSRLVNLTDGSTVAVNWNNGNTQTVTLGGNRTLIFSSGQAGGHYTLILNQDASGNRLVTWPSGIKWQFGNPPTLSGGANTTDVIEFISTGSEYLGSARLSFSSPSPSGATTDNFNSYSDGVLNGENGGSGWNSIWTGSNAFEVQGTVTYEGAKAVRVIQGVGQEPTINRSFSPKTSGTLHWAQRKDADAQVQGVTLFSGATRAAHVWIDTTDRPLGLQWVMNDGVSEIAVGASYTLGNLDTIDLEFDTALDQYRVAINGGGYTGWKNFVNSVASIDTLQIETGSASPISATGYWDDIRFGN